MRRLLCVILILLTSTVFILINSSNIAMAGSIDYSGLIGLGQDHSIAVTKEGEVYTWG